MAMRRPFTHATDGALAARQRLAGWLLAAAITLLAATAAWTIADQGQRLWKTMRLNLTDASAALQLSISGLLQQSVTSLGAVQADLQTNGGGQDAVMKALANAARYDPLSAYLGVRKGQTMTVIDTKGKDVSPMTSGMLAARLAPTSATAVQLGDLVQLPDDSRWYLPVLASLGMPALDGPSYVVALVPARRLLDGADTLGLLPGSSVTMVTPDGRRLLHYRRDGDALSVNGQAVTTDMLAQMASPRAGSFEASNGIDASPSLWGHSRSSTLPLIVGASVPVGVLYQRWAAASLAPAGVLLVALVAVGVFGVRLRHALCQQRAQLETLTHLAHHDSLTGLMTRDAFMRHLDRHIAKQSPFAVLLLDLNHFKDINDTLGHDAGDMVLREIGQRLKDFTLENHTLCARLGGDELAVLYRRREDPEQLEPLCGELRRLIGEPVVAHGVSLELSASIGVALFPHDASTPAELMRRADIAMYAAKVDLQPFGRYHEQLDHFTPSALALRAEFAQAIRTGEGLSLAYQPKICLASGQMVGVEALTRWTHRARGSISPAQFMPLAEQSELIHSFTEFVLSSALAQCERWLQAGHAVRVAVNISANNLLEPRFTGRLEALLERHGVPAFLLELEVTESAVMRHPETMLKRLHQLRDLGIGLAIDDFGTGYASLAYLKRLPVSSLKIDRSFIIDLASDEADRRIVRSSIQLGQGFGMRVVAEGVETETEARLLREFGCDEAQGFHFARPLPAAEFESTWLADLNRCAPAEAELTLP